MPVSVVIPTRNRPESLLRAIQSAVEQTHPPFEVIVVVDGPDMATEELLAGMQTGHPGPTQLRVIVLPEPLGGGVARNIGVEAATGDWIAFLDDDDLWLPEKLAVQLACAGRLAASTTPVLSCPVLARTPREDVVWPRRRYAHPGSMAEYLFCRRGWSYGDALLQTSTLLAPRALLRQVPFAEGLKKHQDWDWLLRVVAVPSVSIHSAEGAPLVIFHVEGERGSVSRKADWRFSMEWAFTRREYFTRRAMRGFLATECAPQAQMEPWRERIPLLFFILREGVPEFRSLMCAIVFLCVPQTWRRTIRDSMRWLAGAAARKNRAASPLVLH